MSLDLQHARLADHIHEGDEVPPEEVIELLKADGHEIIKWNPIDFFKAYKLFADFLVADKGYYFNKSMKYEEIDTSIELNNMIFKTPVFIRCDFFVKLKSI